jgi:predicted permease
MMSVDTSFARYTDAQSAEFFRNAADGAREVPGVVRVAMMTSVPMMDVGFETLVPEGFQFAAGKDSATVAASRIDEHYFDAMGIGIARGRAFRVEDDADAPKVAIVNEQFAKHYWPNQDPIGKRVRLAADKTWVQVVGLARMSKYFFIAEAPTEFIYFPYRQRRVREMAMLVQSAGDPSSLAGPLRAVVHRLDPSLPIYNVRTMAEFYRMRAIAIFNVIISTVASLGLMGLGLALVGLYGLVAYAASRRTREIGIRMAIGADERAVVRLVFGQGLVLAAVGLVIGLLASVGAGQALAAAFPTGRAADQSAVTAFAVVIPIVLAVTFLAAYVPAHRASRISPTQALRHE